MESHYFSSLFFKKNPYLQWRFACSEMRRADWAAAAAGELKKMLSAKTGLHPEDQKLVYKDKERDSKAFLDMAGVRDRSKMVLLEDPAAQAKRLLEQRRTDKAERAAKSISRISLDVDKLATKVQESSSCLL